MIQLTPERLLQSDCQPWAQHRNSREISAESLSALGSALQLQRGYCRVIVSPGLNTATPERLVQSHCFPLAQHFNSREMLAE